MIEIRSLSKTFSAAGGTVDALKNINLTIPDGDIYGIIGMSGAGKSTLVRCINLLERPTEGSVTVNGMRMETMSPRELRAARKKITMIFQGFNLLMQRNCLDNICFPLELEGMPRKQARARAAELLELVGLPDKAKAYPAQLSGGQQQRIAIARALATDPEVLLCDEATSALDPNTTHAILQLIREINRKLHITVIMITHQMSVVEEICDHVAILDNGTVVEEGTVGAVFSAPRSAAAKRLVFPNGADEAVCDPEKERRIRLLFNGADTAGAPLIATMAVETGVLASIISASTRSLDGQIYGTMLLGVPAEQAARALEFLHGHSDIYAEEVTPGV